MATIFSKILRDAGIRWNNIMHSDLKNAGLSWLKVRELKYAAPGKENSFELRGRKIFYRNGVELLHSLKEIYIEEIYKIDFDIPDPYILDCGANMGLSVLYLKERFPLANIVAFEPDDSNFDLLKKNTADLQYVDLVKKAVWKENGTIQFASEGSLSSKIVSDSGSATSSMPSVRLKDYLTEPVEFLKLDIEGAEYEVLRDCSDKLDLVKNLFIEYHGQFEQQDQLNEIFQMLRERRFFYYIKEAANPYPTPFVRSGQKPSYDIQLNIFCFKGH